MTDTERAMLAAVVANPGEDTPKLALADWYDENGNRDRAAIIRAQYPISRGARKPEYQRWQKYATGLLGALIPPSWQVFLIQAPGSDAWSENCRRSRWSDEPQLETWESYCASLPFLSSKPPFVVCLKHGFVTAFATDYKRFLKVAGAVINAHPIEHVAVTGVERARSSCRPDGSENHPGMVLWGLNNGPHRSFWTLPKDLFDLLPDGLPTREFNFTCRAYPTEAVAYEAFGRACTIRARQLAAAHAAARR